MLFLAVLISLFWGSAFVTIRVGLEGYTPGQMAVFRFVIAASVLGAYILWRRLPFPPARELPKTIVAGFFGVAVYHLSLNTGEREVPAGVASILLSTLPLWVILWSYLFLKERLRLWAYAGMALSFLGVLVISLHGEQTFTINRYFWLVILSSVAGSIYTVTQKSALRTMSPVIFNFLAMCFGVLFLLPFSGGLIETLPAAPLRATLAVLYMGILPGALTFVWWGKVLAKVPASRAVSFLYLIPVFASLIAWLWLGEQFHAMDWVGGALTLGGVVLANTLGKAEMVK